MAKKVAKQPKQLTAQKSNKVGAIILTLLIIILITVALFTACPNQIQIVNVTTSAPAATSPAPVQPSCGCVVCPCPPAPAPVQCGCNTCPCPEPEPVVNSCTHCRTNVWLEQPPADICVGSTVTIRGRVSYECNTITNYVDPWVSIKLDRFREEWIRTDADGNFYYTFSAPQAHPHQYWITAKAKVGDCQEGEASVGFNLSSCNQPCGCTVCPCPQPCPCPPTCVCSTVVYPPTIPPGPDCQDCVQQAVDPPTIPPGPGVSVYVPPTTNPSPSQGNGGRLDPNSIQ